MVSTFPFYPSFIVVNFLANALYIQIVSVHLYNRHSDIHGDENRIYNEAGKKVDVGKRSKRGLYGYHRK